LSLSGGFVPYYGPLVTPNSKPEYWFYQGTLSSSGGEIDILGIEPMTQQTVWRKSVTIPAIPAINIDPKLRFGPNQGEDYTYMYNTDPTFHNALGEALSEAFNATFKQIDAYIDPRDLEGRKPEIKELKNKKVY
jgi:hypothetical protein